MLSWTESSVAQLEQGGRAAGATEGWGVLETIPSWGWPAPTVTAPVSGQHLLY